jgi:hypothetical protein
LDVKRRNILPLPELELRPFGRPGIRINLTFVLEVEVVVLAAAAVLVAVVTP